MKASFLAGLLLLASIHCLAEVPEVDIAQQDVHVWNSVNVELLELIISDLEQWCVELYSTDCGAHSVATLMSEGEQTVFYVIEVRGVDDGAVVYTTSYPESEVLGKMVLSYWSRPFNVIGT